MTAKLSKQWACVVVASLVAVAVSSGTKADELAAHPENGACAQSECTHVTVDQKGIVRLAKNAVLPLGKHFRTAKVDDPDILDIHALSDEKVSLEPKGFGETHVLFYDDDGDLIQAFDVQIEHPTKVTWPGPARGVGTTEFQCWATGCEFIKETKYEEPAKVYNYNYNMDSAPPPPRQSMR
jgi:Flp pilus assembly secretin CpaC